MTLSDPEVIRFLTQDVVACWETVRPAPRVTIDFGDGRVLQRTLQGNTVMYVCKPDGDVVDALPGVYTPSDFLKEVEPALEFARQAGKFTPQALQQWHRQRVTSAIQSEKMRITLSKAAVESPLLKALGLSARPSRTAQARATTPSDPLADPTTAFAAIAAGIEDVSKEPSSVERLRLSYAHAAPQEQLTAEQLGKSVVAVDSANNVRLVRPAVHLFFTSQDQPPPLSTCRDVIFKKILHIPIDDPYLGLADILVPGTPR